MAGRYPAYEIFHCFGEMGNGNRFQSRMRLLEINRSKGSSLIAVHTDYLDFGLSSRKRQRQLNALAGRQISAHDDNIDLVEVHLY